MSTLICGRVYLDVSADDGRRCTMPATHRPVTACCHTYEALTAEQVAEAQRRWTARYEAGIAAATPPLPPLPAGWRAGDEPTYVRAFGPLSVCAHPRHGGGWTWSAYLFEHYADIRPDDPDPSFPGPLPAVLAADEWLTSTGIAIASAMYDERLIP